MSNWCSGEQRMGTVVEELIGDTQMNNKGLPTEATMPSSVQLTHNTNNTYHCVGEYSGAGSWGFNKGVCKGHKAKCVKKG